MSIPIDLSQHLTAKTCQTVLRLGNEFGVDPELSTGLSWLVEVMKHIKDTSYNFPAGKYNTIAALQHILSAVARRHVEIYYGKSTT